MALADAFVNIPSGTRPATFEVDSENYHNVQLPNKIQEIAEAALAMSLNSVTGTSTTSMIIGTGAKTLTVQTSKSFLAGMDIRVVSTANPTVNYVNAVITSYVPGTGVLNFTVPSGQAFGSGTLTSWSVFQVPAGGATNTFVQQLVQNQSATAFTTGGTSSAFTLTPSPAISANTANQRFRVKLNAAPTGSPTLAVSGQASAGFKYYDSLGTKQFITSSVAPINWISDVEFDGTDWVLLDLLTPALVKINYQALTTSGNFATPANITTLTLFKITLIAAGAGGGGTNGSAAMGGGGGAGGAFSFFISGLAPSTNYAVVIGGAGAGGSSAGGNGGTGGATTIIINGVTYTASGGVAGAGTTTAAASRTSAQGAVNAQGAPSINIYQTNGESGKNNAIAVGAGGASLPYGTGGNGGLTAVISVGAPATGYGAGGGGAVGVTAPGGAGAPGLFIAEWVA